MAQLFGDTGENVPSRASGMDLQAALFGRCIPVLFGTRRVSSNLIWYGNFVSQPANSGGSGGLFGKGSNQYVYSAAIMALLCQGPCTSINAIWDSGGMFNLETTTENGTVPTESPYTYTVQNSVSTGGVTLFNTDFGASVSYSYSYDVDDYGNPNGPQTLSGTDQQPLAVVDSGPVGNQYSVNDVGEYTFASALAGSTFQVTYTYFMYSIGEGELAVIPEDSPFTITVTYAPEFNGDDGVEYYPSGVALTKVSSGAGKGEYTVNSGVYGFSDEDAGEAVEIHYSWINQDTDKNSPTTLNYTLIPGEQSQEPWSYLDNYSPSQAIGYTGCALICSSSLYLGYTANMPNYTFDIGGPLQFGAGFKDANPADCIEAVLTNEIYGIQFDSDYVDTSLGGSFRDYCTANSFFISDFRDSTSSTASVIGDYLESAQAWCWWSEGLLKFVPLGDTTTVGNGVEWVPPTQPVVSLDDSDYLPANGKDPVMVTRSPWQDAYNKVQIEYSVRENNYNHDVMIAQDDAAILQWGLRIEAPKTFDFITTAAAAQFAGNLRVQRFTTVRNTYEFTTVSIYPYLEPGDIIEISDPYLFESDDYLDPPLVNTIPVRIKKVEDDPKGGIKFTTEDYPWSIASAVLLPKPAGEPTGDLTTSRQVPDNTAMLVVEMPASATLQQGNTVYIFCTGEGSNWGGCNLYYSYDNINYTFLANVSSPGRFGYLVDALPATASPDTTDTLVVQMVSPDADLLSVPQSSAEALVTLSAIIGNAYETVTQTLPTIYTSSIDDKLNQNDFSGNYINQSPYDAFAVLLEEPTVGNTVVFLCVLWAPSDEEGLLITPPSGFTTIGSGSGSQFAWCAAYGVVESSHSATYDFSISADTLGEIIWSGVIAEIENVSGAPFVQYGSATIDGDVLTSEPVNAPEGGLVLFINQAYSGSTEGDISAVSLNPSVYSDLSGGKGGAQGGSSNYAVYEWGYASDSAIPDESITTTFTFSNSPTLSLGQQLTVVFPPLTYASAGPLTGNYAAQSGTTNGWSNLTNLIGTSTGYASVTLYGSNDVVNQSNTLAITDYGFNIPIDATILGIVASVTAFRDPNGTSAIYFENVNLLNCTGTTNQAPPYPDDQITTTKQTFTFGGSSTMAAWGTGASAQAYQINSSSFGLELQFECTGEPGNGGILYLYAPTLSIYYYGAESSYLPENLELIAYEDATLSGASTYEMTYLLRGQYGTAVQSFQAGSAFVRLSEASYQTQYAENYVGSTIYFKALSYNLYAQAQQTLADVDPLAVLLTGTPGVYNLGTGQINAQLSFPTQEANVIYAGPATGTTSDPQFREMVQNDLPTSLDLGDYSS